MILLTRSMLQKIYGGQVAFIITRPSMGLLLHEYSTKMDFYADFIDEGVNCKFETNPETQYSVIDRIRYFVM